MRSKARRALGKYFIPEGDARRVQTDIKPKKRSFDKFRSYFGDKYEKIRKRDSLAGDVSHFNKEQSVYGGGKRKRRKTQRKPKRTRRTKRRTRKSRR